MIVLSNDPETIKVPFGENWTELMISLCAFCFSATIVRDSAPVEISNGLVRKRSWGLAVGLAAHPIL